MTWTFYFAKLSGMKTSTLDLMAKFCFDCGKLSFTALVISVVVRKPFVASDLFPGLVFTLTCCVFGVILNQMKWKVVD